MGIEEESPLLNLEFHPTLSSLPFSSPAMSTDRFASPAAASPEDNALFLDILHEAPLFAHRKAARVIGSVFYCILLAGYATLAVGAHWIFRPVQALISPVLCSCDVLLLLLTGIFQQYLVYQVHKIRLQGYYSFSQKLKFIVRIPFAITAYGTAAMLLVIVWKPYTGFLSIPAILRIIMIVEAVCAGCFVSLYIGYIHQYNSLNSHPDVLKSLYSPLQPSSSLEGLRQTFCNLVSFLIYFMTYYPCLIFKPKNGEKNVQQTSISKCMMIYPLCVPFIMPQYANNTNETVASWICCNRYHEGRLSDQQMALLQYQRENLHFLSEEILRLQECLSKYERTDDRSTPQVDLAHLLAARDQELRTLSAEMNQVQSELRLARSLIDERDTDIQHVRMTNNQYVEENERLRAILGEWSTRAAKLERALEAERMSTLELQRKLSTVRSHAEANEHGP